MKENEQIFAAFVKAQAGFAPALKTSVNPHFRSKYADLAACVEAVIDSLNANGIGLVQKTHESNSGVTVETIFVHQSGESMSGGLLHVPAPKSDPQGYGSALSYARRYSLMAACGIAPEDDDGNAASNDSSQKVRAPAARSARTEGKAEAADSGELATDGERAFLKKRAGDGLDDLLKRIGASSLEALTAEQFKAARSELVRAA